MAFAGTAAEELQFLARVEQLVSMSSVLLVCPFSGSGWRRQTHWVVFFFSSSSSSSFLPVPIGVFSLLSSSVFSLGNTRQKENAGTSYHVVRRVPKFLASLPSPPHISGFSYYVCFIRNVQRI